MKTVTIINAEQDRFGQYVHKIWKHRSLIWAFAKRDVKIRYAQTRLGLFWVLLQPIPSVLIFSFLFGRLLNVDTGLLPYPVFALAGIAGWNYFTNLSDGVGNSLLESQNVLKKVAYPKLIMPLSKLLVSTLDFAVVFTLVLIALLVFGLVPSIKLLLLPAFILVNIMAGFAIGIWMCALSYRYRDVRHFMPYFINFGIWLTPVFYPTTILPQNLSYFMYLNPMALVLEGYRSCLSGAALPSIGYLTSMIPLLLLLISGLWYFSRVEDEIVDYI